MASVQLWIYFNLLICCTFKKICLILLWINPLPFLEGRTGFPKKYKELFWNLFFNLNSPVHTLHYNLQDNLCRFESEKRKNKNNDGNVYRSQTDKWKTLFLGAFLSNEIWYQCAYLMIHTLVRFLCCQGFDFPPKWAISTMNKCTDLQV